jgi:hypothetical protein
MMFGAGYIYQIKERWRGRQSEARKIFKAERTSVREYLKIFSNDALTTQAAPGQNP